jgi:hypothetical protein
VILIHAGQSRVPMALMAEMMEDMNLEGVFKDTISWNMMTPTQSTQYWSTIKFTFSETNQKSKYQAFNFKHFPQINIPL